MIMMTGSYVHHVNIGISSQFGVGVVCPRNAMIGCERHRPLKRARADGDQSGFVREQSKITGEHRCDVPGREDAPARQVRHGPIQQHAAASGVWVAESALVPCAESATYVRPPS